MKTIAPVAKFACEVKLSTLQSRPLPYNLVANFAGLNRDVRETALKCITAGDRNTPQRTEGGDRVHHGGCFLDLANGGVVVVSAIPSGTLRTEANRRQL
jgi:hypothetical protein